MMFDQKLASLHQELKEAQARVDDINFQIAGIELARPTVSLLSRVIERAAVHVPTQNVYENLFTISLPRRAGKTLAYRTLNECNKDPSIVFVDNLHFMGNFRGRRLPFGEEAKVLVFDEHLTDDTMKFIRDNWNLLGYDSYPSIVLITTSKKR